SDTPEKYKDARLIFKDFETSNWAWDPVARAYYWHRFYSHQPDLNYENPSVRRAILHVLDFWLGMGVDGLRLDAVPYLYERDGTSCENLPETHAFLKKVRRSVDERFQDRMLLAEANQWPEDAVAYFGDGDECHMAFHFPVMPRLFMAIRTEDRFPIVEILHETPPIPEPCQWALFLRNHDELTLEMVTDEDRDYMYRVYAQDPQARINLGIRRRLAPLLGNHHRRIELMNGLLLSLPGTPVIYYGDEIGMGDNIYLGDRNGVRTPMQWSADRNAGFSRANPQRLHLPIIIDPEYHYEAVNVEAQQTNPHSRLWWMRRVIALRKRFKAFGHGSLEFLHPENRKVLAFLRRYRDECILVLANLSRFVHCVELDLSAFKGMVPVEMFGRTEFPRIGEQPYFFTLGPHTFYWFALEPLRPGVEVATAPEEVRLPTLTVTGGAWDAVFRDEAKIALEEVLPAYFKRSRWFGGKARQVKTAKVLDTVVVPSAPRGAVLAMVEIRYTEGEPELYALPLTYG
ncbi:MAG: maltose alpha-D-glucosyltransferase, partial [Candidatus Methylomirabilales bacterium]